ncbi:chromosomal replication initiator protein DnaA [Corynebacterium sp. CCM 9187]|uniref:Chromosomal replication initiator protein DnaA n=2 Tax=Corynebacterium pygosceleis TaxID=2800406 RepID=A0A9Q4CA72_9CORY|nr:chromosomal replication initiator protein DnaA [Corynebacterium pygosceleis]MCK7637214.1 chromosomal replication initiator protein DnaA [Corynebacterium pygosceleis]MCK7676151.1 chromosomal replication initiator protein DnaA [Corynebacterium pygosceleis]MCL0120011.1 chromosomal replication initiator protein DnaA [Corynebacterium pygosceleis]MCX7468458.1 chromosomal replication initiator protein DnaA [Corynebacterium pygosceleis]
MTVTDTSPQQIWEQVVTKLTDLAGKPGTGIPVLSRMQSANLQLVRIVALVPGFAVLTTPHLIAKNMIEKDLGEPIKLILSDILGSPHGIAVSVAPENPGERETGGPRPPETTTSAPVHPVTGHGESGTDPAPDTGRNRFTPDDRIGGPGHPDDFPTLFSTAHSREGEDPRNEHRSDAPTSRESDHSSVDGWRATVARATEHSRSQPHRDSGQRIVREKAAKNPNRAASLNERYTFDTFVTGSSNRFAQAAAIAVAESPAQAFNPLFIWGGSGLGKTHLLHAAGHYSQELQPDLRVLYVSSEEFTNDYINSVRDDRQESFKRRYRNLDVLMVDDIQFLEGKEGTQEEFFHTFNALHQADKQIILSSDRPPRQLTTLTDRLRTRFEGGLITDVQPPDLETRIAILEKKAGLEGTVVSRDVLELIASRYESSIRELEGALIRVTAFSSLNGTSIDMATAMSALSDIMPEAADIEITATTIIEVTAEYFNISVKELCGTGKARPIARARQLAMYLCRELTDLSLPKIGASFGGKDHTTVMYADRKIRKEMTEKHDTYDQIQELTRIIKTRGRS